MDTTWQECLLAPPTNHDEVKQLLSDALIRRCNGCNAQAVNRALTPPQFLSYLSTTIENHFGHWVRGWYCGQGDGGLVSHWCCVTHSVHLESDEQLQATLDRMADAVCEWRETLTDLEQRFQQWHEASLGQPLNVQVERAAVAIVSFVIDKNDGHDAWHHTFTMVLMWYLESLELEPWVIDAQLESIVEGQFSSWLAPSQDAITSVAQELGQAAEALPDAEPPAIDTTQTWLLVRQYFQPDDSFFPQAEVTEDAHARFVEEFDRVRSPERGEAMMHALRQCRAAAEAAQPLDWSLLCDWQETVLGERVDFRTTDAFAKGGRERYPITPATPKTFRQHLAEANLDLSAPKFEVLHAALRVYMDICMFHPFPDGNARSARLAMEYVLCKHGLALLLAEPVFRFPREPQCYQLQLTLQSLVGRRAF